MRASLAGLLGVVLSAFVLAGGAGAASMPAVSRITYTPKPLYDDESAIRVSFTANRAARRGYEWVVDIFISGRDQNCVSVVLSWNRDFGGDPRRHIRGKGKHVVVLEASTFGDLGFWCRGPGTISVEERKIGLPADKVGRAVGTLSFRVLGAP